MTITFPNIDPVALTLGPIELRYYSLAYVFGMLFGLYFLRKIAITPKLWDKNNKPFITKNFFDNVFSYTILGILIGGRLGYCLFYDLNLLFTFERPFFDPLEVGLLAMIKNYFYIPKFFYVWEGGMSFHGGLIGVIIANIFVALKNKFPLRSMGDLLGFSAPVGLFLGRIANFINGELYGRPTDVKWAMIFPTDPLQLPRHPSQLYEALLEGLLIFSVLLVLIYAFKQLKKPGIIMGSFLSLYALSRIFIENFRQPDIQLPTYPYGLTMGMMLSLPMFLIGFYFIVTANNKTQIN